jgi:tRNA dimethylallyltransferase
MENVIVIAGPTASGKTGLSIELAKTINGEIISADSMQIYKYMNIGTAKPSPFEMQNIRHYLIDEITPNEKFSVAQFQSLALKYIDKVIEKNKIPVVVGGTGLYINSLIYNIQFMEIGTNWELRKELQTKAHKMGSEFMHNELKKIDSKAAKRIHINDIKRIIRAIEVYKLTNKNISYHQKMSRSKPPKHNFIVFGLKIDRQKLYDRINNRVDKMMDMGLVNEVEELVKLGYDKCSVAMQGLGYKEILWYLKGRATLNEVVCLLKRDTRRYAKRQLTWFNRIDDIIWLDIEKGYSESIDKILGILKQSNLNC